VKIVNCKISSNSKVGILCVGEDGAPILEGNKIENNAGPGIRVGIANKATIVRNEIK
jgi:F-box protein 11